AGLAVLRAALAEDVGRGDVTTLAVVPERASLEAAIVVRAAGRIAGLELSLEAFRLVDSRVRAAACVPDGSDVNAGAVLAQVSGSARAILSAERVALNLLGHLSGIATATAAAVRAVGEHRARIADTRKTTPGLRLLEKYAVRIGGGVNHRMGLDDGVLIKDNHIAIAGGVREAIERARAARHHLLRIEVECDTLEQVEEAISSGADAVLLDNMTVGQVAEAVALVKGRALVEASGGVKLEDIPAIAATGVDLISIGWLTHSAPALDVALDAGIGGRDSGVGEAAT
ncbi:MAG TPA: carboxylating nicotinate-nucleotide diphosphorylase, partial [Gemmatimonadales bacterium]|nr:carboxylating nicotinate-nucleotide diphosphorylase [Gemmatimonadales bacterium]